MVDRGKKKNETKMDLITRQGDNDVMKSDFPSP